MQYRGRYSVVSIFRAATHMFEQVRQQDPCKLLRSHFARDSGHYTMALVSPCMSTVNPFSKQRIKADTLEPNRCVDLEDGRYG
jgi:hypothetical protein